MSRRSLLTQEGADALAAAQIESDLVRRSREQVRVHHDRRRRAVLTANANGASYGVIAGALGITVSSVQAIVNEAREQQAAS